MSKIIAVSFPVSNFLASEKKPALLAVDAAIEQLIALARKKKPAIENISIGGAAGRVLAADVFAQMSVPPEANSAMDGIAGCFAEMAAANTPTFTVSQRIPAGCVPVPLEKNTVARIFTGAILPAGADTVVMQENCAFIGEQVQILQRPTQGENVRAAGQDIKNGALILAAGARLTAAAIGLLAAAGVSHVPVHERLRVAVLSTGDELLTPGDAWVSGHIFNSNRPMLSALLAGWDCAVLDMGSVKDSRAAIESALREAATQADVIISTGGVSVGEEDHVKAALTAIGRLDFWKIAIKPGKPVAVGSIGDAVFLGLPGNPQSVFVTALLLARPFLLARQGQQNVLPAFFLVPANFAIKKMADRREYLRVKIVHSALHGAQLERHPQQSSGALSSAVWGDGLAVHEVGTEINAGDALKYLPFSALYWH